MTEIMRYVQTMIDGKDLTADESARAMQIMLLGGANPSQISSYLTAQKIKGVSVKELSGALELLIRKTPKIEHQEGVVFICASNENAEEIIASSLILATLNVPTYVRFSKTQDLHVAQALGINMEMEDDASAKCLREANVCFSFGGKKNPLRHLVPIQEELEFSTILDILMPLVSPVSPAVHICDIASDKNMKLLADAFKGSGCKDGMLINPTTSYQIKDCKVSKLKHSFQLQDDAPLAMNANEKAGRIRSTITGQKTSVFDLALLRAAYVLLLKGTVSSVEEGIELARGVTDSTVAMQVLEKLVEISSAQSMQEISA